MRMIIKVWENSKKRRDYGHFEPNVGWSKAVSDIIFVSETVRKRADMPLFLLYYSMGSFYQDELCNSEANYMMDSLFQELVETQGS